MIHPCSKGKRWVNQRYMLETWTHQSLEFDTSRPNRHLDTLTLLFICWDCRANRIRQPVFSSLARSWLIATVRICRTARSIKSNRMGICKRGSDIESKHIWRAFDTSQVESQNPHLRFRYRGQCLRILPASCLCRCRYHHWTEGSILATHRCQC